MVKNIHFIILLELTQTSFALWLISFVVKEIFWSYLVYYFVHYCALKYWKNEFFWESGSESICLLFEMCNFITVPPNWYNCTSCSGSLHISFRKLIYFTCTPQNFEFCVSGMTPLLFKWSENEMLGYTMNGERNIFLRFVYYDYNKTFFI